LIHALALSMAPINEAFERDWPAAQRMNLLDDSLSSDLAAAAGVLDEAMTQRFERLADHAVASGAHAILFSCSAFGPCIDAVARRHASLPVLKPNSAMVEQCTRQGGTLGLVASFAPTLQSMPREFPSTLALDRELAVGALDALGRGDAAGHDQAVVAAAERLVARGCKQIALAQFSMARAAPAVRAALPQPVWTSVDSAIAALRECLG
jgi:hypothetical protein